MTRRDLRRCADDGAGPGAQRARPLLYPPGFKAGDREAVTGTRGIGRIAAAALIASLAAPVAAAGDAQRGRALLLQRQETGCILCHVVPGLPLGGAIGPPLLDITSRLDADALRARIADARRFNPDTVMPPTRSTAGLHNVAAPHAGRTLLTEQALNDIVAYLMRPVPAPDAAR